MEIDNAWAKDNIDIIMKQFLKIHPKFKSGESGSRAGKSIHKKKMLENMDTLTYRPIYYIARFLTNKERVLRDKIKQLSTEKRTTETSLHCWKGKYDTNEKRIKTAFERVEEQYGRKSYEYQLLTDAFRVGSYPHPLVS
jgi:hypothetical protein